MFQTSAAIAWNFQTSLPVSRSSEITASDVSVPGWEVFSPVVTMTRLRAASMVGTDQIGAPEGPFCLAPAELTVPEAALLAGLPATASAAEATSATAAKPHRVVFQVNEDDSRKWNTILGNINNVQEELGKVEVAVVVIGPALGMLKADALTANKVQDAMSTGVRFVACGNSMQAQKLEPRLVTVNTPSLRIRSSDDLQPVLALMK